MYSASLPTPQGPNLRLALLSAFKTSGVSVLLPIGEGVMIMMGILLKSIAR